MKPRQIVRQFAISLIILLPLSGCEALPLGRDSGQGSGGLAASGVVEAVEISVAPEVGGRVAEVFVSEGDTVAAGDRLLRLEDSMLEGQRRQAEAALEAAEADAETARAALASANARLASAGLDVDAAEAALDQAEAGVRAAEARLQAAQSAVADAELGARMARATARQAARSERIGTWDQALPDAFVRPPWYFQKDETLQAAESEVAAAQAALEDERVSFAAMMEDPRYDEYRDVATRLAEARAAFRVAEKLLAREIAQSGSQQLEEHVQERYDAAESELEAAQSEYEQMLSDEELSNVLEARARLAAAAERFDTARDLRDALLTEEESLAVRAAEAAVHQAEAQVAQAEAALDQAEAGRAQAQIAVSQAEAGVEQLQAAVEQAQAGVVRSEKAVAQAQASLDLVELRLEKLVVWAAVPGTVTTRNVQPGEVIQPGTTALTLGYLDELTVTVYIAESDYGRVSLGDQAQVTVDSFPERTFDAVVTHIADEAEFTPRNVQTTEERQSIVFAVELSLEEGVGQLKPGMPADVLLQQ